MPFLSSVKEVNVTCWTTVGSPMLAMSQILRTHTHIRVFNIQQMNVKTHSAHASFRTVKLKYSGEEKVREKLTWIFTFCISVMQI